MIAPLPSPVPRAPVRLTWRRRGALLEAFEPDADTVAAHALLLRDWYNAPENASMMGGSGTMTAEDVVDFWRELREDGGRGFLSSVDGVLVGDMDLRHMKDGVAEFAIMIGAARKGEGLGKAFAAMLHTHAFRDLGVTRLFVPPKEANARVHALNDFLGYQRDDSPEARAYADEPDCVTSSLTAEAFRERHPDAWAEVEAR